MPTILRQSGFRFFFYSNENDEPPHIHIEKGDASAKVWLDPIEFENAYDFSSREIKQIQEIVTINQFIFIKAWNDYFN
jgi:Domain of unknown function (DUF4160)